MIMVARVYGVRLAGSTPATPFTAIVRNKIIFSAIRHGKEVNMRKVNLVTRTLTTTRYEVMCLNVETAEVLRVEFTLIGKVLPTEKALKALKADFETDTLKVVHIENTVETSDLYGMSEQDFIKYADIIKEGGR